MKHKICASTFKNLSKVSKKTIFLFVLVFPLLSIAQQTYVPDDNFEQALINLGYDNILDDYVLTSNIDVITILNINSNNIFDLTGIEDFILLEDLYCTSNQLTSLDISSNQNLKKVYCDNNQLTIIDLNLLTELVDFSCLGNLLTTLDLSLNQHLKAVNCPNNQIQNINFNDSLEILYCYGNNLSMLDFGNHRRINDLFCGDNNLISLIVDSCTNLEILRCGYSQLSTLDVSTAIRLKKLYCTNSLLTNLLLNDSLQWLECNNNLLTNLYLNDSLEWIDCYENQIINLNLNGKTALWYLRCNDNQITTLDASSNNNLQMLICFNNKLNSLDLRNGIDNNFMLGISGNPDLYCISVDDTAWANINWTVANGSIDSQHYFSFDCSTTGITEIRKKNRSLLKIVDILGRETNPKKNTSLFYIYSDGMVKKRVFVE